VYYIHPGVEGNVFGMQTLYHNLSAGKKCVYVASSSDPTVIKSMFEEFGWNLAAFSDQLIVVDAYSGLVGATSKEKYLVENPESIDSLTRVLENVMKELSENATENWNKYGLLYDHVLIYNFTAWPYKKETLGLIKDNLFDALITVGGIAEQVIFGQYFEVMKAEWSDIPLKSMLFRVLRPGGIRIDIPKIVVTSPFNAGKSTFVHALSMQGVSVDRIGTTVAL
jgi:hypothetical protein